MLVAWVGGARPSVGILAVQHYLFDLFKIRSDEYKIATYRPEDFILRFNKLEDADRILHAALSANAPFLLLFKC